MEKLPKNKQEEILNKAFDKGYAIEWIEHLNLSLAEIEALERKDPPGFMLFREHYNALMSLSDEQLGRVIRSILDYKISGEKSEQNTSGEHIIYPLIIDKIQRDVNKYREQCRNGQKSAVKRWKRDKEQA